MQADGAPGRGAFDARIFRPSPSMRHGGVYENRQRTDCPSERRLDLSRRIFQGCQVHHANYDEARKGLIQELMQRRFVRRAYDSLYQLAARSRPDAVNSDSRPVTRNTFSLRIPQAPTRLIVQHHRSCAARPVQAAERPGAPLSAARAAAPTQPAWIPLDGPRFQPSRSSQSDVPAAT